MNIAVLGAGAWGTALAVALSGNNAITLWCRDAAQARAMRADGENRRYLPGIHLGACAKNRYVHTPQRSPSLMNATVPLR